jgi:hypothetical protein
MNPNPAPNFALMSSVDITAFTDKLFTRSNAVYSSSFTKKVYEDIITFLNGRGMAAGKDLSSQLLAASSFGTNWHLGIDASDKAELSSSHAFKIKFNASSTIVGNKDILGIGTDFILYSGGGTIGTPLLPFKVTSPSEWSRGEIISFSYVIEEVGSGTAVFNWNFSGGSQDLIVACRSRGNGDLDDSSECLEAVDLSLNPGAPDIRYYLNDAGKVVSSYIGIVGISWSNIDLRNRLGFTGNETAIIKNGYSVLTADNYCPGVLIPSRPYKKNSLSVDNSSQSRRMIGGGYVSNYIGSYVFNNLSFDLDARLDKIDLYRHFTNNFISYISQGERINFYQVLGDSRRSLIHASSNFNQASHDLLYTTSRNGYEGRVRASLLSSSFNLSYPGSLRRRVPVSIRIEHL